MSTKINSSIYGEIVLDTDIEVKIVCLIYYFEDIEKCLTNFDDLIQLTGLSKPELKTIIDSLVYDKKIVNKIKVPDVYDSVTITRYAIKMGLKPEISLLYFQNLNNQ